jgi:uncharacterized membrane protein SpoIIM required for sporulation
MITNSWIGQRKDNWNRLDVLLRQVESNGIQSLNRVDLRDFGLLYRQAAADLSAARADASARSIEQYLNRLVSRAHNYVYSGNRVSAASVWRFFAYGYPRLMRRLMPYVVLATAVFIFGGLLGSLTTLVRPDLGDMMLGHERAKDLDHGKMWTESILTAKPQTSSAIMTNNIMVCFLTFTGGITAGLFTLWLLLTNGINIGVIAVACARHHMSLGLWSFVAGHGALEIPSIMFAGAAGLRLGAGILFPGMLRRREAIAVAGTEAVQLLSGIIPLLIVAGSFEAFFSPTHIPVAIKFSTGAILFTGLCWWLGEGGRKTVNSEQ